MEGTAISEVARVKQVHGVVVDTTCHFCLQASYTRWLTGY